VCRRFRQNTYSFETRYCFRTRNHPRVRYDAPQRKRSATTTTITTCVRDAEAAAAFIFSSRDRLSLPVFPRDTGARQNVYVVRVERPDHYNRLWTRNQLFNLSPVWSSVRVTLSARVSANITYKQIHKCGSLETDRCSSRLRRVEDPIARGPPPRPAGRAGKTKKKLTNLHIYKRARARVMKNDLKIKNLKNKFVRRYHNTRVHTYNARSVVVGT